MIGVMLGPAADMHLRRALAIAEGDWTALVTRPTSGALLLVAMLVLVGPALLGRWRAAPRDPAAPAGVQ
jgi:putative tricarboxylic transport membrane protein